MGGPREVGAGAVQPRLYSPYHQAETWRCGSFKREKMMGKGRRTTPIAKPRRDKHHSSWKGVKDLAGKISHLKRENSIRGQKSPGPGSVIRPHEKFLLGSNLCPLCPGLLIWSETAGYMSLC